MLRRHLLCFALPLLILAAGCEGDPSSPPPDPTDVSGSWVLVSTALGKAPCESGHGDTQVEPVTVTQTGRDVVLEFADYAATGTLEESTLTASGQLPGGQAITLTMDLASGRLEGTIGISGDSCGQDRAGVLTPRLEDEDFSGHWEFDLEVVGSGGCEHIQDYGDCFRILQNGTDLLVVDDTDGNLFGSVVGNVAEIVRDQPGEKTSLVFFKDPQMETLSGTAIRVFMEMDCRTSLVFQGVRSDQPCANPNH